MREFFIFIATMFPLILPITLHHYGYNIGKNEGEPGIFLMPIELMITLPFGAALFGLSIWFRSLEEKIQKDTKYKHLDLGWIIWIGGMSLIGFIIYNSWETIFRILLGLPLH